MFFEEKLCRNIIYYWSRLTMMEHKHRVGVGKLRKKHNRKVQRKVLSILKYIVDRNDRPVLVKRLIIQKWRKQADLGINVHQTQKNQDIRIRSEHFRAWRILLCSGSYLAIRKADKWYLKSLLKRSIKLWNLQKQ